jgi:hypothetical protein
MQHVQKRRAHLFPRPDSSSRLSDIRPASCPLSHGLLVMLATAGSGPTDGPAAFSGELNAVKSVENQRSHSVSRPAIAGQSVSSTCSDSANICPFRSRLDSWLGGVDPGEGRGESESHWQAEPGWDRAKIDRSPPPQRRAPFWPSQRPGWAHRPHFIELSLFRRSVAYRSDSPQSTTTPAVTDFRLRHLQ